MARHLRKAVELGFEAIAIEGGLIAPEQVAKIAATARDTKATASYDVPKGLSLGEEIARFFRIGQAIWRDYDRIEAPTVTQAATFVRDLLTHAFGFDDLTGPHEHHDGTRRYRIAWEAKGGRVPIVVAAPAVDEKGRDIAFTRALPEFGDGSEGRARRSPIVLLQDWLNANSEFYWGLVFAGDRVRLMRDNSSLTRAAWIEADLGAMFRDEMFADFTAWWLLTHASRFGAAGAPPSAAPLEQAREAGMKQGTAARERLREGVETALAELGQGLVEANPAIRERLATDAAATAALFEELLRTVYRLIFLAVAEDRDLLHPRATGRQARDLYAENYSFSYWRQRSTRHAAYDAHHDAWEGMKVTLAALEQGQPLLGLPALGGLFARDATPTLNEARIPNRRFLKAIWSLGYIMVDSQRARINWRDMKTEELGSVYESLLEIRPRLSASGEFELDSGTKGNQRKTTGSYYTPDSLVETLLDSALDPVLEKAEAEGGVDAILDLKVIDPACGSGHFLLGAARRMAERVAELRDPDSPNRQAALRDVVARCIHGVDRNPMAVELAKVALWIESVSPGQPLGFLDANIRCGDALLGVFDLEGLEQGIPDDAYKPLTGDDKKAAAFYKKKNKDEKKGQGSFDFETGAGAMPPKKLAANLATIRRMPEDTVGQVEKKREAFEAWRRDPARWNTKVACDLYTAAFLLPKAEEPANHQRSAVPTTADVWKKLGGGSLYGPLEAAALHTAEAARAFHWPLAFPDVLIGKGGFDAVLGNPPWDVMQLSDKEFFASSDPEIAALTGAARKDAIDMLAQSNPHLYERYQVEKRFSGAGTEFARNQKRYELVASGKINTFSLFASIFYALIKKSGLAGAILPVEILTSETLAPFFRHVTQSGHLREAFAFENEEFVFPGIANVVRFCLVTLEMDGSKSAGVRMAHFLRQVSDLEDARRIACLTSDDFNLFTPTLGTSPIFRSQADYTLSKKIFGRFELLRSASENSWVLSSKQGLFNMTSSSSLFRTREQLEPGTAFSPAMIQSAPAASYLPLYEGKFISHFDHRFSSYHNVGKAKGRGGRGLPPVTTAEYQNPEFEVEPRYWVAASQVDDTLLKSEWNRGWLLGWRDISNAKVERTVTFAAIPRVGVGDTASILFVESDAERISCLLGNFNSLVLDYCARQIVGGTHLTFGYLCQLPILPPRAYTEADLAFIVPRVLELSYTSHSLAPFARDLCYEGPPFAWDEDRRAQLRAELDAWYALAYGLTRDELRYVLDPKDVMGADYPSETFRVLQNNEMKKHGEYRTRRLVLAAYDKLVSGGMQPRTEGYR